MIAKPDAREFRQPSYPAVVHTYTDLLRILRDQPMGDVGQMAELTQRDRSNIRRDLRKLSDTGVIDHDGACYFLTDKGRKWVAGQDVAEGLASAPDVMPSAEAPRWPIDQIRPNPANRKVTGAGIADLAASIQAAKDILQPLILTPPDADGVRMILAGERRWRAANYLFAQAATPKAMRAGVPFVERAATEAEALQITIIENSQRQDLSPWQDAQLLHQLQLATGWSGAELARNIGRVEEGSRSGLRDVQTKLQIAREATPEAIAAYEADGSWDRLRDSVKKPKAPDNVHLALFLAEVALRAEDEQGVWDGVITVQPGLQWPVSWEGRWFTYGEENGALSLKDSATDWLAGEGLGDDPDALLKRLRAKTGITDRPEPRPWVSECLNWTPDQAEADPADDADPLVVNGVRYPNATRAAEARRLAEGHRIHIAPPIRDRADAAPADEGLADQISAPLDREEDAMPALTLRERLALVELAHKINMAPQYTPGGEFGASVGSYWLASSANTLKQMHLVRFVALPGGVPPLGLLTDRARDWLRAYELWGVELPNIKDEDIRLAQAAVGEVTWPTSYATDWIANEAQPAADLVPEPSAEPVQTDVEDAADEAARVAAALTLSQAQAFIARDGAAEPFGRHELARLLDACHATGTLRSDDDGTVLNDRDEVLFQFDPNSDLPDDLARAGADLVVHVINTARARHHGDAPNPWPAKAPEDETLNARLLRTGEAVRSLMVLHYDELRPDPASEAAYAEFSSALKALQRHELAQAMGAGKGEAA